MNNFEELKKANAELRRKQKDLLDFLENAVVGLHWVGANGIILWANKAEMELLGYTKEEYIGHSITEFHADENVICDILDRLKRDEKLHNYEARLRHKDGSIRHVLISSSVLWENGEFVHTRCFTRDVTDRKLAEAKLRESEARKIAIFESALDCIVSMNHKGMVVEWNPAAVRTFGHTRAEALGKEMALLIIPEQYRDGHRKGLAHFLLTGEGPVFNKRLELSALKADGTEFPVELTITKIAGQDPPVFTGYIRDLTEYKKSQSALKENMGRLAQSNKELEHFAYVATHDLQEPLRKIIVLSERLAASDRLGAAERDYADRLQRAGIRMRSVIEDVLQFSSLTYDESKFSDVDLNKVINELLSDIDIKIAETKSSIEVKKLPAIHGNSSQMRHLFQNLILNSIKFAQKNQSPRIVIDSEPQNNGTVKITVTDNGIGFNQGYMDKIFQPFQKLHGKNEYAGTGIGLAICKKIAEQHGGQITAEGELGIGSKFIIILPAGKTNI